MLRRWKRLRRDTVHDNPWWSCLRDEVELPSGAQGEYYHVETPGAVMVIPILDDGRVVLLRQYRYLNDRDSLEFPGGGMRAGQDPAAAAAAELAEEAGYAGTLRRIGIFNPWNGVTSELCTVFIAERLRRVASTPDPTEEFLEHRMTPAELSAAIRAGEVWDGMTIAAWGMAGGGRIDGDDSFTGDA